MSGDRNEDEDDVAWVSFSSGPAQQRMIRGTTWCQWRIQILTWTGTMTALSTRIHLYSGMLRRRPAPLGVAHHTIGCYRHCPLADSQARKQGIPLMGGEELRKQTIESNSDLQEIESMDTVQCEDLMDDVNNISEIISDACKGIDFKTIQIGVHS